MNTKNYFIYFSFACITLILSVIWFHGGYLIALGESTIPFYSLRNLFAIYSHVWTPVSLGFYQTPVGALPFFAYGLLFELLGLPNYVVQGIVFFTLAFIMLLFSFIFFQPLFTETVGKNKKAAFVFGSLFYLFNLISLVSVWNRMQYPFMLFYACLPIGLFLFAKGIKKKNYLYSIYLGFALIPFSMVFIAIPFTELFWGILFFYAIFHILLFKDKKATVFITLFLFACVIVWALFDSWWLMQFLQYTLALPHSIYTTYGNLETLNILSDQQGNSSYVFRLINRSLFLQMEAVWGSIYFTPFFIILSYIIPFLAFFPLLVKKKPKYTYFFLAFSLIAVFLTKGTSGPFGSIFTVLFSYVKAFEVFRSAFEKFGLIIPIAYAPCIVFSLIVLMSWSGKKFGEGKTIILFVTTCILLFGILTFPFWNGWIFTYYVPHANNLSTGDYVKVPAYYKTANDYLNKDSGNFRTIVMPIENDGVTYNWSGHGFTGVDYTNGLFSKSFVTLSFGVSNLDLVVSQFQDVLFNAPKFFTQAMNFANAKYFLIRKDIDYKHRTTMNPEKVEQYVNQTTIPNLTFEKQFGDLLFYKNNKQTAKIYPANTLYAADQAGLWRDIFNLTNFQPNDIILNTGIGEAQDTFIDKSTSRQLIYPTSTFNSGEKPLTLYTYALQDIPKYYRYLPGNFLYAFIRIKEQLAYLLTKDSEVKFFMLLDLTLKRMGELHRLVLDHNTKATSLSQKYYVESLAAFTSYAKQDDGILQQNITYVRQKMADEQAILDHLLSTSTDENTKTQLQQGVSALQAMNGALGISPYYPDLLSGDTQEIVYRYRVSDAGRYEIVLRYDQMDKSYEVNIGTATIQVNNIITSVTPTIHDNFMDFGEFSLNKGINEVAISLPKYKNLTTNTQGTMTTLTYASNTIPLDYFQPTSSYRMIFEYRVNRSYHAGIRVNTDIDYTNQNGQKDTAGSIDLDTSGTGWVQYSYPFTPYRGARDVSLSFTAEPISTCLNTDTTIPHYFNHCVERKNTKPLIFSYRNLHIERVFTNQMILLKTNDIITSEGKPNITYKEVNASQYIVTIKHVTDPFILAFSENFDSGWQASYKDTGKKIVDTNHFLADSFANAWYVTRKGDYQIMIHYSAEDLYTIGKIMSLVSGGVAIVILILRKFKK